MVNVNTYKAYIEKLRRDWIGVTVEYNGGVYRVVDVDYNGALLIDLPAAFTDTTAVARDSVTIL